jgi:hypothetical protein
MADFDDPWIASRSRRIDPKILHALGLVNLSWNACEHGLLLLFCSTTNIGGKRALILTHDLGDVTLSNKIRDLMEISDHQPHEREAIERALDVYEICRLNRNQLSHFTPSHNQADELEMYRKKGPTLMEEQFPCDLATIRRVADEITHLTNHLSAIGNYFLAKLYGQKPGSLPQKPPLPGRVWTPPPQGRPKQKSPQPPSGEKS